MKEQQKSTLEDALIASEIRYRRLFESAKDGILILDAESGRIMDVNPFLIDLLGYSKEDFIEKAIWEIGPFADIIENREKFIELQQKKYVRYDDLPLETSTGKKIHVELVSNVYVEDRQNVIQCNIRDITKRKHAEHKLYLSEKKFSLILENSADAIFVSDQQGKYLYVNAQVVKLLGFSKKEMLTFTITDISPEKNAEEYLQIFKGLLKKGRLFNEIELVKKDGRRVPTDLNAVLLSNGLIYASCRDISDQKKFEKELIAAKEKAEESDLLKSAFLANMSHEIRTPMNGILGFTELLKEPRLTGKEQQEYIGIIEKSGARMLNIINDIIAISKIESKNIELNISEVNIDKQVSDIYNFFKPEAEGKKLHLSFKNLLHNDESNIKTDKDKVDAILTNLVKNAIKYSHSGSIEFGCMRVNQHLEYFVKDTGIGIPKKQKETIFERFNRGSKSTTHNFEGAGLGLSISKAYVELLGGKIWVENNSDVVNSSNKRSEKGSVFYFSIPYSPVKKSKPDNNIAAILNVKESQLKNKKIKMLVVEDDKVSGLLIELFTRDVVKELFKASNGFEAVEICRINPDIDLVMMDINMPVMDGYEATRKIREFNKEVVIIAQTAYGYASDREMAMAAGCNDYISKPINQKIFRNKINTCLIKKRDCLLLST